MLVYKTIFANMASEYYLASLPSWRYSGRISNNRRKENEGVTSYSLLFEKPGPRGSDLYFVKENIKINALISSQMHMLPECQRKEPDMKRQSIKAKVTKRGLIVPKRLLEEVDEVEIRKEDHRIIISPVGKADPILNLGKKPVKVDVTDGSERHDIYLYGPES